MRPIVAAAHVQIRMTRTNRVANMSHVYLCGFMQSMTKSAWTLLALAVAVLACGCATRTAANAPLSVGQVVEMSRNGVPASAIIGKMKETRTVYLLPGSSVAMLRSEGVPEPVLDYMRSTRSRAEREQADECFKWVWCIRGPPYMVVR